MGSDLAPLNPDGPAVPALGLSAETVKRTMSTILQVREFVLSALKPGEDFVEIPGVSRPVLGQPGAEKIAMLFNCRFAHEIQARELADGHVEYIVTTSMISRASGDRLSEGIGSCTTLESKYRYRNGQRRCPRCHQETIYKSKQGSSFFCWKSKGGCGAEFMGDDRAILGQKPGKIENDNIHDMRNTVLKMAKKRADVDAAKSLGCVSGQFTQDMEDGGDREPPHSPPPPPPRDDPPPPPDRGRGPGSAPVPPGPKGGVMKPGAKLWNDLGATERDRGRRGLRDLVVQWGAGRGWNGRMVDWSAEQVAAARDHVAELLDVAGARS